MGVSEEAAAGKAVRRTPAPRPMEQSVERKGEKRGENSFTS